MEFGISRAVQLASRSATSLRAGRRPGFRPAAGLSYLDMSRYLNSNLVADRFEVRLQPARELVCDLQASRIVQDMPNYITFSSLLAARRPAREPPSVLVR